MRERPGSGGGSQSSGALSIAWIGPPDGVAAGDDGQWGAPGDLSLPLDDRGLLLADGLFETVLVERGVPLLLERHLQRWHQGAAVLGMAPPPDLERVRQLAAEAMRRSGIATGALRLNWSRGSGGRGLDPPVVEPIAAEHGGAIGDTPAAEISAADTSVADTSAPASRQAHGQKSIDASAGAAGRFWLQLTACAPVFTPVIVIVSPTERRCASSELSRIKTFAYGSAIQARRQAHAAGADDALLLSTAGGLCCGTAANLLLQVGHRWLTPALASGCLPGVMRHRALERGLVEEAPEPIAAEALGDGTVRAALLLNSLGCRPIVRGEGVALTGLQPAEAEMFWRRVLEGA
ncbi:MAG: aminotransferase class IV [Cyanobium sp.]